MTLGEAEWIEVIGFKGCIIIWRIQRMCLCSLPTHFVLVWRRHDGGDGGGGLGLGLFTPVPVLVSPIGLPVLPTAAGLCVYCMYMIERCLWTRMQIAHSSSLKSWCSLIRTTSGWPQCVHLQEKTHVFSPVQGKNNLPLKWKMGRLIFKLFIPWISKVSAPVCFTLTLLATLL